jgi:hypothetical protein
MNMFPKTAGNEQYILATALAKCAKILKTNFVHKEYLNIANKRHNFDIYNFEKPPAKLIFDS